MVASGPSAENFSIARYAHVPMLAMNGSINKFLNTDISPLIYICDDDGFARNRSDCIQHAVGQSRNVALSEDVLREFLERGGRIPLEKPFFLLRRVNRFPGEKFLSDRQYAYSVRHDGDIACDFSIFRQRPNRIGFSRNMSKGYFNARTIAYAALQIACHIGAHRAFLVGVDLQSSAGRFYEKWRYADTRPAEKSRLDKDYPGHILPCFQLMSRRVAGKGFDVFNLSQASRLPAEVVPKIDEAQFQQMINQP